MTVVENTWDNGGSIRDITRLMTALGQIKELSDSKQLETKVKNRYKENLDAKDRELVSILMLVSQKNELLQYLKKNLQVIRPTTARPIQHKISEMLDKIESTRITSSEWDTFKIHFEKLHPGFFDRLQIKHPALTRKEKRLCAYLRLNLSTKEIANLLNITPESTEISRVRLRKKLDLTRQNKLSDVISRI